MTYDTIQLSEEKAMQKRFVIVALAIATTLLMVTAFALLTTTRTVPSTGTIYAFRVTVYANEACTDQVYQINWTTINPGGTDVKDFYVKNDAGNLGMDLSMATSGWSGNPTNTTDVATLTWNATSHHLAAGESACAEFTLAIADNAETQAGLTFSFDVNVTGDEA